MSVGVNFCSFEEGRVYATLSREGGSLAEARSQLGLTASQRFACNGREVSAEEERLPLGDWIASLDGSVGGSGGAGAWSPMRSVARSAPTPLQESFFGTAASTPRCPTVEVSPRGFVIAPEFTFAGLAHSQRVFGCAATSVRLVAAKQHAAGTRPLRFFIASRIARWAGAPAGATPADIEFAVAVAREVALLLSARGASEIVQLRRVYFGSELPESDATRDLYVVVDEGAVQATVDFATFTGAALSRVDRAADEAGGGGGRAGNQQHFFFHDANQAAAAASEMTRQLLDGVAHMHELGVVHGALSPRSVLVSRVAPGGGRPDSWRVFLRDLGIVEAAANRLRRDQLCARRLPPTGTQLLVPAPAGSDAGEWPAATTVLATAYREDDTSDAALALLYAAPETLVGAPPTAKSDMWAVGAMLAELFASLRTRKHEPLLADCGAAPLSRADRQDLWERVTVGAGCHIAWAEACNRYSETLRPDIRGVAAARIDIATGRTVAAVAPEAIARLLAITPANPFKQASAASAAAAALASRTSPNRSGVTAEAQRAAAAGAAPSMASSSRYASWSSEAYRGSSSINANNVTTSVDASAQPPSNLARAIALSASTRRGLHTSPLSELRPGTAADSSADNSGDADGNTAVTHGVLVPLTPSTGAFATYLSMRGVVPPVAAAVLSLLSFFPERRPAALAMRRNTAFYATVAKAAATSADAPAAAAVATMAAQARLAFAVRIDQSEMHQATLAVVDSVARRETPEAQRRALVSLALLIQGLARRGAIRGAIGIAVEGIVLSKSGVRKLADDVAMARSGTAPAAVSADASMNASLSVGRDGAGGGAAAAAAATPVGAASEADFAMFGGGGAAGAANASQQTLRSLMQVLFSLVNTE
jgi:serine/threonine protein kinase